MPKRTEFDETSNWVSAQEQELNDIESEIIKFRVADGYAIYRVLTLSNDNNNAVLQHFPFLDAYQIRNATLRGLRRQDIESKLPDTHTVDTGNVQDVDVVQP